MRSGGTGRSGESSDGGGTTAAITKPLEAAGKFLGIARRGGRAKLGVDRSASFQRREIVHGGGELFVKIAVEARTPIGEGHQGVEFGTLGLWRVGDEVDDIGAAFPGTRRIATAPHPVQDAGRQRIPTLDLENLGSVLSEIGPRHQHRGEGPFGASSRGRRRVDRSGRLASDRSGLHLDLLGGRGLASRLGGHGGKQIRGRQAGRARESVEDQRSSQRGHSMESQACKPGEQLLQLPLPTGQSFRRGPRAGEPSQEMIEGVHGVLDRALERRGAIGGLQQIIGIQTARKSADPDVEGAREEDLDGAIRRTLAGSVSVEEEDDLLGLVGEATRMAGGQGGAERGDHVLESSGVAGDHIEIALDEDRKSVV